MSGGNSPADLISIEGNKMLDREGFNLWTESYDEDVELSEEMGTYPFAGYSHVLGRVYSLLHACVKPGGYSGYRVWHRNSYKTALRRRIHHLWNGFFR